LLTTNAGGCTRLRVGGDIDLATADDLRQRLETIIDGREVDVEIDMAHVDFCDSTGLHVLLNVHHRLEVDRRRMCVVNASPPVQRLLDVSGLRSLLAPDG